MGTWHTRGLRGSGLEDLVNHTNDRYREKKLALIQKIPTPITPIEIDKEKRHITLAYFEQKSTVDYIGTVQGLPVCFDAKECKTDTFPLKNIHPHQMQFMKEFEQQGGISFILLSYTARNEIYYLPFDHISIFWNRMENGGRKSFTYEEIDHEFVVRANRDMYVHYLEPLQKDLNRKAGT
ncbi:MAG: Holliday junction resolvase RecU [Lachnospiraceae bacterium]|jgi:recombination protein U|nr:Holliday junction resolvase RecU [Lachnospiraceae bacterium]